MPLALQCYCNVPTVHTTLKYEQSFVYQQLVHIVTRYCIGAGAGPHVRRGAQRARGRAGETMEASAAAAPAADAAAAADHTRPAHAR